MEGDPKNKKSLYATNKAAYADSVLKANSQLDWVKRLYQKNAPVLQLPGEPYPSTHLMSDDGNGYVFPSIVQNTDGTLRKLNEDEAYQYARQTDTGIQLPKQQGSWFASNGYKLAPNVNNDISQYGIPFNNPNYGIPNISKYKRLKKKP